VDKIFRENVDVTTTPARTTSATQPYLDAVKALGVLPSLSWEARVSPRRRKMALQVGPDGVIVLALPAGTPVAAVTAFVAGHSRWLATAVARQQNRPPTATAGLRLADGQAFELLGDVYRLRLEEPAGRTAWATSSSAGGVLHLPKHLAGDARAVIAWYCAAGLDWMRAEAAEWERRLELARPPAYVVRDLGVTRLGTYDPRRHVVTLHWQVFQLPPPLARCAGLHELVHATRPGGKPHGPQFRARFDAVLPGNRALERQARIACQKVWRGTVVP
jgi:predicted metal-dependent hydrolase